MVSEVSLQQTGQTHSVIQPLSEQEIIQTSQARVQGKCLVLGRPSSALSSQSLAVKSWTVAITRPSSLALLPVSQALKVLGLFPMASPELLAGRTCFHLQNWRKITADPWVLEAVQGYRLELMSRPEPWSQKSVFNRLDKPAQSFSRYLNKKSFKPPKQGFKGNA